MPSVAWFSPDVAALYMQVTLTVNHIYEGGQGDIVYLVLNNATVYNQLVTFTMGQQTMTFWGYFYHAELMVQPWQGCDYGQMSYRLTMTPLSVTPSTTSTASRTSTASPSASATNSALASESAAASASATNSALASKSASYSPSPSQSTTPAPSQTPSGVATATTSASASASASATMSVTPTGSAAATPSASFALAAPPYEGAPPPLPANLTELSPEQITTAFNSFSSYSPALIQDNLQLLGAAALGSAENFTVETPTYSLAMKSLGNASAEITSANLQISMPPLSNLVAGAASAAVIQWKTNPYVNASAVVPDSPIVSFSVLNSAGEKISVRNLAKPISMNWNLEISDGDPRLQMAPSYVIDCVDKKLFLDSGTEFTVVTARSLGNFSWDLPCLFNTSSNFRCTGGARFQNFACPAAVFTYECLYWNSTHGKWASDGCSAVHGSTSSIVCECNHLTDFSARLGAVAASNEMIFEHASSVYSLSGLARYAEWYGIFGGIALLTVLLAGVVVYLDARASTVYVHALLKNKLMRQLLAHQPEDPVFVYDENSSLNKSAEELAEPPKIKLSILGRILQQHNRLQFFFRFDPRLSRLFRLLFLFVVQFHSLFVTALFYSFTYNGIPFMWYDTIVLALITTGLNFPVVKLMFYLMNKIGTYEFKFCYPLLYNEYTRRAEFERYALVYLKKKAKEVIPAAEQPFCGHVEDLAELTEKQLLREMAAVIREGYPYVERYSRWRSLLPAHTFAGIGYLLLCFGWLGWCLNYLLLFAAAYQPAVGEHIMTSYATSELSNVFLIQPVAILVTIGGYWVLNKYSARLPLFVQRMLLVDSVRSIPALYYFSDPWNNMSHTSFTSEFSYNIFVRSAAIASGADELSYAPMTAIAVHVGKDGDIEQAVDDPVVELYKKMWAVWVKERCR
jgi:hypothetical protein